MHHVGVAGHVPPDGAEELELLLGEVAPRCQCGIKGGGSVALGEDQAVPVGRLGVLRVHLHHVKVKDGQDIRHRQRAADVAGGRRVDLTHGQAADLGRCQFQGVEFPPPSI